MAIKLLVFDFRESERDFFRSHELENFEILIMRAKKYEKIYNNLLKDC